MRALGLLILRSSRAEIHGFPGIAFEVTGSGHVETVWLF